MKNMCRKKSGIFVAVLMVCVLCVPAGYAGAAERTVFHSAGNLQSAPVAKVKLSATKATVVIGSTLTLTVKNLDDSKVNAIKWKSNRTSIAKVNQKGVVTPVKAGTTTIKCTITYKDKTKQTLSCTVTVKKRVKATAIIINNTEKAAFIKVGERVTLKPTLSPENTTDQIYWFSSNKAVATVGLTSGKVTAKKEGMVVITAKVGMDKKGATAKTNKVVTEINIKVTPNVTDESFFDWAEGEDGIVITGYKKELPEDVVIPEKINKLTVTSIGGAAFEACEGLISITIPNSVTSIGSHAFSRCRGLTSITIPNSVTSIGSHAFSRCGGLTSVTIPNSVTEISGEAFIECELESIQVEKENEVYDSRESSNAIIETKNNCLITGCKSTTIPNSVTSIGEWAFYCCRELTSITIPNSVTSIGSGAFYCCEGLTSITVPNSVTSIDGNVFACCYELESIQVAKDNKVYDSRESSNAIIETKNNCLITGCKSTTIPNSVTSIDRLAFYGCRELTSITIPNSVTSIGSGAFYNCKGLTSITIPNSVTEIDMDAFSGCEGLTSITIPNSVTSINDHVFSFCRGLTSITIPNSVTKIGYQAFCFCSGLTSIAIPNSVTHIDRNAFNGCSDLEIHGQKDSYAQRFAEENNIPFIEE